MAQINLNITLEFARALEEYMRKTGIKTKSEAIRAAVGAALERLRRPKTEANYQAWIGQGLAAPLNRKPRFQNEDDLWS